MNDEMDFVRAVRPPTEGPDRSLVDRERSTLMTFIETTRREPAGPPTPARRRRRRRWMIPAGVAAVAATAAAGWAYLQPEEAREATVAGCTTGPADPAGTGANDVFLPNDGTDPVEACRELWESGTMEPGVTEAPPLVACVAPEGAVTVVEGAGDEACEAAGMAPWAGAEEQAAVGEAVRSVRIDLHDHAAATGDRCATEADWRGGLEQALAEQGLTGWTIEADQIAPSRHCYDIGRIDAAEDLIVIIGFPGEDSLGCDPRSGC